MRLQYPIRFEEIIDVYDRALARSRAVRRWLRINAIVSGLLAGLIVLPFSTGPRPLRIAAIAAAVTIGVTLSNSMQKVVRRRHLRRLLRERMGDIEPLDYEVESSATGLRVRQGNRSNSWTWADVEEIRERRGEVEIWLKGGPLVLIRRNRLPEPEDASAFVEEVRHYVGASAGAQ